MAEVGVEMGSRFLQMLDQDGEESGIGRAGENYKGNKPVETVWGKEEEEVASMQKKWMVRTMVEQKMNKTTKKPKSATPPPQKKTSQKTKNKTKN